MVDRTDLSHEEVKPTITFVRKDDFIDLTLAQAEDIYGLPSMGGSSREHYWHFLLGYLLPLVHEQKVRRVQHFGVLNCGPLMTPILTETLCKLNLSFEITQKGAKSTYLIVRSWDQLLGDKQNFRDIESTADLIRKAWSSVFECPADRCPTSSKLLIARSPSHWYYKSQRTAEVPGYGLDRRGVINWPEVCRHLNEIGIEHDLYEPGAHSFACQISTFTRASAIVGIRGAEWANLLWAKSAQRILVFNPYDDDGPISDFARSLGIQYASVRTKHTHCIIEPDLVARFLVQKL